MSPPFSMGLGNVFLVFLVSSFGLCFRDLFSEVVIFLSQVKHIDDLLGQHVSLSVTSSSHSSSSRSSDGNCSLLNEGGSASQVPQASVELVGCGSVVWPDSLSEWLVDRAGLQQMFCCLTASTTRALFSMANAEFGV